MLGGEGSGATVLKSSLFVSLALLLSPGGAGEAQGVDPLRLGKPLTSTSCPEGIPRAICAAVDGGFWVASENPPRLHRLGVDGRWQETLPLPAGLTRPTALAAIDRGRLVIGDVGGKVHEIDPTGVAPDRVIGAFGNPAAICFDPATASITIADGQFDRLVRLLPDRLPLLLDEWAGQRVRFPHGLAVSDDGALWISDRGKHRLLRVDGDGEVSVHGDFGSAPGLLAAPMGIFPAGSGRVLVADRDNHRIQVIGPDGRALHSFGVHALVPREAGGRLHYPTDVVLDSNRAIAAVIEPSERRVQLFGELDSEGGEDIAATWERVDPISHYGEHWALEMGGDLLAISEPDAERVVILDRSREIPIVLSEIGGPGAEGGRFRQPAGLAFLPGENPPRLVVADRGNSRLQIFQIDRETGDPPRFDPALASFVRSVDLALLCGTLEGGKTRPRPVPGAIAVSSGGTIHLIDEANDTVLLLDRKLRWVGKFDLAPLVRDAVGIASVGDDTIITDFASGRIYRFDDRGRILSAQLRKGASGFGRERPWGVAGDGEGGLWVTDAGTDALVHIDSNGEETILLVGPGTGSRQLFRPRAVAVDGSGEVWVLDHGNHRGARLDRAASSVRWFGSRPYLPPREPVASEQES